MVTERTKKIARTVAVVGGATLIGLGLSRMRYGYVDGSLEYAGGLISMFASARGDNYVTDFSLALERGLKFLYRKAIG